MTKTHPVLTVRPGPPAPFQRSSSPSPGLQARLGLLLLCWFAISPLRAAETNQTRPDPSMVRFCISSRLFQEVNENDARASMKVYARQIAEDGGLIADPNPRIFRGMAELNQLLKPEAVDVVSLPVQDFLTLDESLVTGPLLVGLLNGSDSDEYVLLVRGDSAIHALADLKAHPALVLSGSQGELAECWLEVLLGEQKLGLPEDFFSQFTRPFKPAQSVLPVFFRQAEAGVTTRQSFEMMGELNPQVTNQLRVLASSHPIITHVTCFRAGFDPSIKAKIINTITAVGSTVARKQMMTIFKCDRVEERPRSRLQTALDLLAARARLQGSANRLESASLPSPTNPPARTSQ